MSIVDRYGREVQPPMPGLDTYLPTDFDGRTKRDLKLANRDLILHHVVSGGWSIADLIKAVALTPKSARQIYRCVESGERLSKLITARKREAC